jgi:hypothetical protein
MPERRRPRTPPAARWRQRLAATLLVTAGTVPGASATACSAAPLLVFRAQPPQLATSPGTALEVSLHAGHCVQVVYPQQQGGGGAAAVIPEAQHAVLLSAVTTLDGEITAGGHSKASARVDPSAPRWQVIDGDLLSLEWRQASRRIRLRWRAGDTGLLREVDGQRAKSSLPGGTLAELERRFRALAEALRIGQMPVGGAP